MLSIIGCDIFCFPSFIYTYLYYTLLTNNNNINQFPYTFRINSYQNLSLLTDIDRDFISQVITYSIYPLLSCLEKLFFKIVLFNISSCSLRAISFIFFCILIFICIDLYWSVLTFITATFVHVRRLLNRW